MNMLSNNIYSAIRKVSTVKKALSSLDITDTLSLTQLASKEKKIHTAPSLFPI